MTKQVQRRRGTSTQHTSFTGAEGELSVNTTNKSVHVHDGVTAGGVEAARADLANVSDASLNTALAGNTLSSLTITSADINGGTIDGTVIGGTTPAAVTGTTITGTSFVSSGDMTFGDNDKAIFGAGSDLQIYHNGSNSIITNTTGTLIIQDEDGPVYIRGKINENSIIANADGAVEAYYNNSLKLATTATGVDVTGTITSYAMAVAGDITIDTGDSLLFGDGDAAITGYSSGALYYDSNIHRWSSSGAATEYMRIDSSGNVGIGTSSPTYNLQVTAGVSSSIVANQTSATPSDIQVAASSTGVGVVGTIGSYPLVLRTAGTERMRIDSSGRVGIGTSSLVHQLTVSDGTYNMFFNSTSFGSALGSYSAVPLQFYTNNTERMRIDSSGNLLVGKTSAAYGTAGVVAYADGGFTATKSSDAPVGLNRLSTDGAILTLSKDGTTVGSIGTQGSKAYIGTGDAGLLFDNTNNRLDPCWPTNTGSTTNGALDLGGSTTRFKDLYLSGGVYLGGTGSANLLDDYEEGTWTPSFKNAGTGIYNIRTGYYTKIGSLVTVQCHISLSTVGTASGDIQITGFPFAGAYIGNLYGVSSSVHGTGWTTPRSSLNILLTPGLTESNTLYYNMASSSAFGASHADIGTGNLLFSMTYRTD